MIDKEGSTYYSFQIDNITQPVVVSCQYDTTETKNDLLDAHYLLFVMKGKCRVSREGHPEIILQEKEFTLLPYGGTYQRTCYPGSYILWIRIKLTARHHIDTIMNVINNKKDNHTVTSQIVPINDILESYLEGVLIYLERGLPPYPILYFSKIKELFFILERYYTHQELLNLISPVLNLDFDFAGFVLGNWKSVKNASELIHLSMYCETTFNKKFKRIFFTTPYKWLNQHKAVGIYDELLHTDEPFKVIAEKFNFNSLQQFNDYCVRNFRTTPGSIRKLKYSPEEQTNN
ncbi:MAG: helix-turn-helix domain-containing protein [Tannerellaceae bacterium]|nr:helix-turn-helix domain-containing protein [Tannerellaceae bacterium]